MLESINKVEKIEVSFFLKEISFSFLEDCFLDESIEQLKNLAQEIRNEFPDYKNYKMSLSGGYDGFDCVNVYGIRLETDLEYEIRMKKIEINNQKKIKQRELYKQRKIKKEQSKKEKELQQLKKLAEKYKLEIK